MSYNSMIILAFCVVAGIVIDIFIVINFFSKSKRRKHFYKEIISKTNFKPIEADSYVLKTNRFGDIVKNDFLVFRDGNVKIVDGIMKYNVDESIVFCDCLIEGTSNSGKKCRPFTYNLILHFRKLPVSAVVKVRLGNHVSGKCPAIFDDLKFLIQADGFSLSSGTEITPTAIPAAFLSSLGEYKKRFPFVDPKQNGLLIFSDKGWLILSISAPRKDSLESLLDLDRNVADALVKKHV